MKLKLLGLAILSTHLVACASQPHQANTSNLSHKVYQGYEYLVGKESYAFDGRAQVNVTHTAQSNSPTLSNHQQEEKKQLLSKVIPLQQFSAEQVQWLKDGVEKQQVISAQKVMEDDQIGRFTRVMLGRFFYDYQGVVDLKQGQISLDSTLGYSAKNAQAWIKVPAVLDFKKDTAYIDLSALSPILTDEKYDGRYIAFDLGEVLDKWNIDKKPLLAVLRDYMLVNAAAAKESDYQVLPLTDAAKQQNAVEQIRYTASYEELMAQYQLYFYLNQDYLKSSFKSNRTDQDELSADDFSINSLLKLGQRSSNSTASEAVESTANEPAKAATIRLKHAFEQAQEHLNTLDENTITDEDIAVDEELSACLAAIDDLDGEEKKQLDDVLQKFKAYKKSDALVTAQELKKIIHEQSNTYAQLVAQMKTRLSSLGMGNDKPMVIDMAFDRQGRIVRSETQMDLSLDLPFAKTMQLNMVANFSDYGQAKIDQQHLKNSVKWSEAANENTLLGLKDSVNTQQKALGIDGETWSNEQLYHKLAESLLAKNMSFIEAYTLVYRYAYLLEGDAEILTDDQDALDQLNSTGRWLAIYFAQEYDLPFTLQHAQEYEDSPDEWEYYDDKLSDRVWDEFYKILGDPRYAAWYEKLKSKHKDQAKLFSAIYYEMDLQTERERYQEEDIEYPEGFDKFVEILGKIAIEDMKTQQVNPRLVEQLDLAQLDWLEDEIYQHTYNELLKHQK